MANKLVKLHRSQNHRMIAGVMGGIAEYLGWNVTLVRLLFVIISTASVAVPGILIYIVLWIVMPNATQSSYRAVWWVYRLICSTAKQLKKEILSMITTSYNNNYKLLHFSSCPDNTLSGYFFNLKKALRKCLRLLFILKILKKLTKAQNVQARQSLAGRVQRLYQSGGYCYLGCPQRRSQAYLLLQTHKSLPYLALGRQVL